MSATSLDDPAGMPKVVTPPEVKTLEPKFGS